MSEEIDFKPLGIEVPNLHLYNNDQKREIYSYLSEMSELDKKAYLIAQDHLKTSFNVCKSNGFKQWKNKK